MTPDDQYGYAAAVSFIAALLAAFILGNELWQYLHGQESGLVQLVKGYLN